MPSLSDKLKSLGVQVGVQGLPHQSSFNHTSIDKVVAGQVYSTQDGETYVVEKKYPAEFSYGSASLIVSGHLDPLLQYASPVAKDEFGKPGCNPENFAYLDIETTGLMGGTGTYAFLVGVGRFEGEVFHLAQFFMRDPSEETAHLLALEEFLSPCDVLVTYNGKSFDAPLLNTRYLAQGWKSPLVSLTHLDLLPLARRFWRERLPSRTLGNIETFILGAHRTQDDVPGWMIPQIYFDYLRNGDASPLQNVFYHNEMDILAMAALLNHISQMLEEPSTEPGPAALDLVGVGRFYEDIGRVDDALKIYKICLSAGIPETLYWETVQRVSFINKRLGDYQAAIAFWELAASQGQLYAHVELAKHYEHRLRDFENAIRWTRHALEIISQPQTPRYLRLEWKADLEHRLARLEKKFRSRRID
jgi:uncharacterized protein